MMHKYSLLTQKHPQTEKKKTKTLMFVSKMMVGIAEILLTK